MIYDGVICSTHCAIVFRRAETFATIVMTLLTCVVLCVSILPIGAFGQTRRIVEEVNDACHVLARSAVRGRHIAVDARFLAFLAAEPRWWLIRSNCTTRRAGVSVQIFVVEVGGCG